MNQLKSDEYPAIYAPYVDTITGDPAETLKEQLISFPEFITAIPEEKAEFAYAEGKWTIKEVLGHVIDTERIMAYRVLRFGRNDTKELAGFDDEEYVRNARFNERTLADFSIEFTAVRRATILLYDHFNEQELMRRGIASERMTSVRGYMYVIAGHLNHHRNLIRDRYLVDH